MTEVTAIFDIGKTNKKLFFFDNRCNIVYESSAVLPETIDDDGFPCEDIQLLKKWILEQWNVVSSDTQYKISALNFTAYGASLVNLDKGGQPITPLYNYLKPYPNELAEGLYKRYGGKWKFSVNTCSPPMGTLNSGLQLLWLKYKKPTLFAQIKASLHLPQYLSFLFSGKKVSEFTSIGCHTALWDFTKNNYHPWLKNEEIEGLLAPLNFTSKAGEVSVKGKSIPVGVGLHDSSAALIAYLKNIKEPFLLISTGTWCITFNPFNTKPLTREELALDCLCYMTPQGKPVKASRIFLGREHEFQSGRIEAHFDKDKGYCNGIKFDAKGINSLLHQNTGKKKLIPANLEGTGPFPGKPMGEWDLAKFSSCEEAYLQLIIDLTSMLKYSAELVGRGEAKTIFVEGGFGDNEIFMTLLANHFPNMVVKSSFLKQATALGAVLQINEDCIVEDWKFRSYEASSISELLKAYYNKFWSNQGM